MVLAPRLDLRQSQQLVMTPQLQQAIKLLQFSNLELAEYVTGELENNPLLETRDADAGPVEPEAGTEPPQPPEPAAAGDGDAPAVAGIDQQISGEAPPVNDGDNALDVNLDINVYNNDSVSDAVAPAGGAEDLQGFMGHSATGGGSGGDGNILEQTVAGVKSLQDHLREQMMVLLATNGDRLIGAHIIDLVNDAGYVDTLGLAEIPERLGCDSEDVAAVLGALQTSDPAGVFACSLAECLALQLRELDRFDPAMEKLIDNLALLGKRELGALRRLCRVDAEDLADMIGEIQALNPKPGLAYGSEAVQAVVPDVFVRKSPAGTWTVALNTETLPRVLVNNSYYAELAGGAGKREDKVFLNECLANANWLVKALDQRARTILKVSTELVRQQEGFFNHGVSQLKPLNLKAIADEIDMHESTVSRVTASKYLATERGVFDMKFFFTSAIQAVHGGDAHSAEAVRQRIKDLIDSEDPKKILSDDKIVKLLKTQGVDIARRTVAKYREAMKIPSSVDRRRQKNLAAG